LRRKAAWSLKRVGIGESKPEIRTKRKIRFRDSMGIKRTNGDGQVVLVAYCGRVARTMFSNPCERATIHFAGVGTTISQQFSRGWLYPRQRDFAINCRDNPVPRRAERARRDAESDATPSYAKRLQCVTRERPLHIHRRDAGWFLRTPSGRGSQPQHSRLRSQRSAGGCSFARLGLAGPV
jgi:hypothetical protein